MCFYMPLALAPVSYPQEVETRKIAADAALGKSSTFNKGGKL